MSDTVKLIIEIPEKAKKAFDKADYNYMKGGYYDLGGIIGKAIKNGTPLKAGEMLIPTSVAEALLVLKGLRRIYDDNDGDKHIIDRIMEKVRTIAHYHAMNNAERKESEDNDE